MNRRWMSLAAILLLASYAAAAEDLATDAERSWRELRSSSDVKTKLLAERWYGLVKLQEWNDATGKFKTSAKYLAHDPNLAWVKLRVIRGVGDKRVVKDVQIPLEKLSSTCQSRVRQISRLSEKISVALEEEKKREAEKEEGGASDEMAGSSRGGRGEDAGRMAGMDAERTMTEREPPRGRGGANPPPPAGMKVTNDGPALPALLPPLPGRRAPASAPPPTRQPVTTEQDPASPEPEQR